ncbi:hypothetical protein M9H77_03837 [Catharanthus roseus]|uniref:Uncharacterized protein n=1 Tax=Catharanthus roseus TaxID=4058 RepID=A0ACC0CCD5_CATRO|nr:hypothetical protein M9H77_03837 [Catharanthus roseus]
MPLGPIKTYSASSNKEIGRSTVDGPLNAKQSNGLFLPINKGIPKVESSWKKHSSSRQMKILFPKVSYQRSSSSSSISLQCFWPFSSQRSKKAPKPLQSIKSSKSVRFEKKLSSPQVNTLPKRRIGGLSYILGIP